MMRTWTIYKIMLCCLITLLSSACGSEDLHIVPPHELGDDTYIELKLSAQALSRTQTPDTEGTEEESVVSNARVFLVEKGTQTIIEVPDIEFILSAGPVYTYEAKAKLPSTIKGNTEYYVYVVANSQAFGLAENNWEGLIGTYASVDPSSFWSNNRFLMVNTVNNINEADKGGVAFTFKGGKTNEVIVNIERLAVKVVATATGMEIEGLKEMHFEEDGFNISEASIKGATLVNCVNQFNLIQQWQTPVPGNHSADDTEAWLITPSTNINYSTQSGYYNKINNISEFQPLGSNMYCLENNSPYYNDLVSKDDQQVTITKMKGRTTAILFQAQVKLSKDNGEEGTFYRYGKRIYATKAKLISDYPLLSNVINDKVEARKKGVECFENGYMYYIYWMVDNGYYDNGFNYYSVMRNTWYKVNVLALSNLGKDTPESGYREDDPIDGEENLLTVQLAVNKWTIKPITHILK